MYTTTTTATLVAAIAVLYSASLGMVAAADNTHNLVADASTITDSKSFEEAVSKDWVSIFYQVNQNLNDAKYGSDPAAYQTATWLYGTTALPPSYVPTWAPGYLDRAHQLHEHSNTDMSPEEDSSSETDTSSSAAGVSGWLGTSSIFMFAAVAAAAAYI